VTTQLAATVEWPTYFGPDASPLFGVLHLPADQRVRAGVIICESLGKEGMDSLRFQRILADDLAAAGFAVLRFDYLGTGDSAYRQHRDDAVSNWVGSVRHAVDYLFNMGATSIGAVAIRAGGLILNAALPELSAVDRVVYIDPVVSGRRYLREKAALFQFSVGTDDVPDGTVSTIGGILSDKAAQDLSALTLNPTTTATIDRLMLVRPGSDPSRLQAFTEHGTVDVEEVLGLPEFARTADIVVAMPMQALTRTVSWLDGSVTMERAVVAPRRVTSIRMPDDSDDAGAIVETIETIGRSNLFAIRSRPENSTPGRGKVVVFFNTSNDPHVGPAREWVELSRRLAAGGVQAVRWDRSGIGNSGPIVRAQWQRIYSTRYIADGLLVVRQASADPRNVSVVGICSGSWYAAHAARSLGLDSAILINPGIWNWRSISRLAWQWNVHRDVRAAAQLGTGTAAGGPDIRKPSLRKRVVEYLKPHRDRLKTAIHARVPRPAMRMLGWSGLSQVPEVLLGPLTRTGTSTTVILSPYDAEIFGDVGGYTAAEHLLRANLPLGVQHISVGDHAAYHQAVLTAIRQQVLLRVDESAPAVEHAVGHTSGQRDPGGSVDDDGRLLAQPAPPPHDIPTLWSLRENPRPRDRR
jgi:alpha-beta hydrolase superfamily lysophospholipase